MKAMQEQTRYNTTPDQGWSQMKAILDQEMPAPKRSRRMIFFWWSFAGLMLIGLTGTYAFQQGWMQAAFKPLPLQQHLESKDQPLPNPQQDQIEQDIQPAKSNTEINNEFAANESAKASNTSVQNHSVTAAEPKSNTSGLAKWPKNKKLARNNDAPVANNNHVAVASATGDPSKANTTIDSNEQIVIGEAESTNEEMYTNVEVLRRDAKELGVTENVPSLEMMFFTIPVDELGPVQANEFIPVKKNHVLINPGVEVSGLSGFNGGLGWYAGATADVKVASRLNLTTGVGYREFNPGASLFPSAKDESNVPLTENELIKNDNTIFDGFYLPSESVNNASYQDLDPVIESVHQWQVQAGADWRFSKRFSLEGGLGFAFHTRAFSEYPIVPLSYANSASSVKISNSLEGYEVVRESMVSCFAGVSYRIGKHIALKAQWLHTFQPYLDTDQSKASLASYKQRDDFIRGITVGMKYSIL